MKAPRILVVGYGGMHIRSLLRVIKNLTLCDPSIEITILGLTTARQYLLDQGIECLGFKDLVRPQDLPFLEYANPLLNDVAHPHVSTEESIAYMGLSYYDLEMRLGKAAAQHEYAKQGRNAFLPVTFLMRFLSELRPDLVLTTACPRAERAAIEAAAILGIPAVCLANSGLIFETEFLRHPHFATKICVFSQEMKDLLISLGRSAQDIIITGDPCFDYLKEQVTPADVAAFRETRGIDGKKLIFYASQPEPRIYDYTGEPGDVDLPRKVDAALFACLERHKDWFVVIRLHPTEEGTLIRFPARSCQHRGTEPLAPLLHACDLVVTFSSTVGLEAAFVGKPVISIAASVHAKYAPFMTLGLGTSVAGLDDLESAIEVALQSTANVSSPNDFQIGSAGRNVADVVRSVLSGVKCST